MDKRIKHILEHFNFEKVHKTMVALNWKWSGCQTEDGIPTVGMIMVHAQELLEEIIKDNYESMAQGGLAVSYDSKEDYLQLQFIVADWDNTSMEGNT